MTKVTAKQKQKQNKNKSDRTKIPEKKDFSHFHILIVGSCLMLLSYPPLYYPPPPFPLSLCVFCLLFTSLTPVQSYVHKLGRWANLSTA